MSSRIFIGRLPDDTREKDLDRFFGDFGEISDIQLRRGFGFVVCPHLTFAHICCLLLYSPLTYFPFCLPRIINVEYAEMLNLSKFVKTLLTNSWSIDA